MKLRAYFILLIILYSCQYTIGQKDTLFVNHLVSVKLNIDKPFIPVINCTVEDSISEIVVYFQFYTNNNDFVLLHKADAGGGSILFGYNQWETFKNGFFYGVLKHSLPDSSKLYNFQKRSIQFLFHETTNGVTLETNQRFLWIGGRKNDDD